MWNSIECDATEWVRHSIIDAVISSSAVQCSRHYHHLLTPLQITHTLVSHSFPLFFSSLCCQEMKRRLSLEAIGGVGSRVGKAAKLSIEELKGLFS